MDIERARARLIKNLGKNILDKRVLDAMSRVPRERFVPENLLNSAYEDIPLPIGLNQTISQPYIVALMTQALELKGDEKVLEIGTGSGYQTAVLAELAAAVVTVERLQELQTRAVKTLDGLGYTNIVMHPAGPRLGWPEDAPYQAMIVTAGAPGVPASLIDQLAIGGRLVIPVGSRYTQELYKITRQKNGNRIEDLGACRFVSLISEDAWNE